MGAKQTQMPTLAIFHLFSVWQIFSFGDYFVFSFLSPHNDVLFIAIWTRRHLFIRRLSYGTLSTFFFFFLSHFLLILLLISISFAWFVSRWFQTIRFPNSFSKCVILRKQSSVLFACSLKLLRKILNYHYVVVFRSCWKCHECSVFGSLLRVSLLRKKEEANSWHFRCAYNFNIGDNAGWQMCARADSENQFRQSVGLTVILLVYFSLLFFGIRPFANIFPTFDLLCVAGKLFLGFLACRESRDARTHISAYVATA